MNPIDFYMWGNLAAKMFDRQQKNIIDFKETVSYFANSIELETVAELVKNVRSTREHKRTPKSNS